MRHASNIMFVFWVDCFGILLLHMVDFRQRVIHRIVYVYMQRICAFVYLFSSEVYSVN